jgi:hypothetical protein
MTPWEISPGLSQQRLQQLALIIDRVRADALEDHRPEKGDDPWTFGCMCYRRTVFAVDQFARSGDAPWLEADVEGLRCTLFLEGEPIKFYRGDPESPSDKFLTNGFDAAVRQGKLKFYEDELASEAHGWFWLLTIQTQADGTVLQVWLLQVNRNGETRVQYPISIADPLPVVTSLLDNHREGADLPPPAVQPKTAHEATEADDVEADGSGDHGRHSGQGNDGDNYGQ